MTPVSYTETLFVVVEGNHASASDQQVYQVQFWRVIVLRRLVHPADRIPQKEI